MTLRARFDGGLRFHAEFIEASHLVSDAPEVLRFEGQNHVVRRRG